MSTMWICSASGKGGAPAPPLPGCPLGRSRCCAWRSLQTIVFHLGVPGLRTSLGWRVGLNRP
jgi:hypothetical protein